MVSDATFRKVERHIENVVTIDDLARLDWKRQTDVVQDVFLVATMFAELGNRAVFIDGNISDNLKHAALTSPAGVKQFFNRRCHDQGIKSRRFFVIDTVSTRSMGKRGRGPWKLHIHGVFELREGQSQASLIRELEKVFGKAASMGRRQFHVARPQEDKHFTLQGRQGVGAIGKLLYALAHVGATYRDLELNGGKRSRKAPTSRRIYNEKAQGLARGIPSNFNSAVVFADSASKRAARLAFTGWVKLKRITHFNVPEPTVPLAKPDATTETF